MAMFHTLKLLRNKTHKKRDYQEQKVITGSNFIQRRHFIISISRRLLFAYLTSNSSSWCSELISVGNTIGRYTWTWNLLICLKSRQKLVVKKTAIMEDEVNLFYRHLLQLLLIKMTRKDITISEIISCFNFQDSSYHGLTRAEKPWKIKTWNLSKV